MKKKKLIGSWLALIIVISGAFWGFQYNKKHGKKMCGKDVYSYTLLPNRSFGVRNEMVGNCYVLPENSTVEYESDKDNL